MARRTGDTALDRWFLRRVALIGAGLLIVAGIAWIAYVWVMDDALLTTDPDLVPQDPRLVAYANAMARPLWTENCASCHGADMKGKADLGAANLVDDDWLYGSGHVSEIEYTVTYGIRSGNPKARNLAFMPSFVRPNDTKEKLQALSPAEIRDVSAYIFSLGGRRQEPGAVARGARLYTDKGACYDCHTPDARGDHEVGAPNLTDNIWLYGDGSPRSVFRSIAEGHAGVCPAWQGRLTPLEIRALAVLVNDRSHAAPAASQPSGTAP